MGMWESWWLSRSQKHTEDESSCLRGSQNHQYHVEICDGTES